MAEDREIVDFQHGQLVRVDNWDSVFHDRMGRIVGEWWEHEDEKSYIVKMIDEDRNPVAFYQDELKEVRHEQS